jgi:hypothetical protein
MLLDAIAGLRQLSRPTEIVIHDNGSTDVQTLAVLRQLERGGIRVFRRGQIASADALNNVNTTIQEFFLDWGAPQRYVVSDCDIDLSIADPRALEVYDELLTRFRDVHCVGPMLRIRDIPPSYPLYNRVINRHVEQFWHRIPEVVETSLGHAAYIKTAIDTTLALHRAGQPFRRLKTALRVYEPYEARHLDWYLTDETAENEYAETSNPAISHWNNRVERDRYRWAPLEHRRFFCVRKSALGSLEIYEEQVMDQARPRRRPR